MRHGLFAKRRIWAAILCGGGLIGSFGTSAALADDAPPIVSRPSARAQDLSDEQVVNAMHRGIDFLLGSKNGDNFEGGQKWNRDGQTGGETAIVLLALLNAGASLRDDNAYSSKLDSDGKDLAPVVHWLSQVDPQETYAAGLMASALTLVPKRPDSSPGEGPQAALERDKFYLLSHMGADGGYTYGYPNGGDNMSSYLLVFENYFTAKTAKPMVPQTVGAAKDALDNLSRGLRQTLGGADVVINHVIQEMNYKEARALKSGDDATARQMEAERRELNQYYAKDMPKDGPVNLGDELGRAQKDYAAAQKAVATNDGSLVKKFSIQMMGMVPRAPAELQPYLDECKIRLEKCEFEYNNHFAPIGDLSNSQYGTLGFWALCDSGMEYPMRYWQTQNRFWRLLQHEDGGWPYAADKADPHPQLVQSMNTMTAAGVASLYVAEEFTDTTVRLIPKTDKSIDRGVAYLASKFNPHSDDYYYMYGVERVGLASGLKFFGSDGTVNWYKEGAKNLIARQSPDGSWTYRGNSHVGTAYGLLFLARGRNPVVFNKLQYDGYWNARPRDDANITRWMSKEFERPINWQVVSFNVSPDEWLDAPVLLITGSKDPKFTPEDIDKLRSYVSAGGIIFSTSDGPSADFTKAMQKYAVELVHGQYEMKELPRTHELFHIWKDVVNPPRMFGMSNGVRELWIHSTVDMGASWQARKTATKENFIIPANLYFYATGKGSLRSKLAPLVVADAAGDVAHTVALARVEYPGNFDPEPGAWPRAVKLARVDFRTALQLTTVKAADLDATKNPIAHLTGTSLSLGERDVAAVKRYLDAGGFLFGDAAGGKAEFTKGFLALARQIYPEVEPTKLPDTHPIIAGTIPNGQPVGEAEFRKFARFQHTRTLDLEAIIVNGKMKMLLSPYDITSGLLGTQTWGIVGYTPETAETLVQNILLWSQTKDGAHPQDSSKSRSAEPVPIPAINFK